MSNLGHKVLVVFLSNASDIGRCPLYEKKFLDELLTNNVKYVILGNRYRRNLIVGTIKFKRIVRDFGPSVIHCHLYYALFFSFFVKSVKVVYTHHSIALNISPFAYKFFDLFVDRYIGICESCVNLISSISSKAVVKIYNSIDANKVVIKKSSNKTPIVLMVGRLTRAKNYPFIIEVVSKLRELDFLLLIAGEGEEELFLKNLIDEKFLSDKIRFLGNISNVPELLSTVDIFAMCSSWEGLPISLLEATLSGLPVIVTDVGGCSELVSICKNGIVVKPNDLDVYASELNKLVENPLLRNLFGDNGIKCFDFFSLDNCVSKHLEVYS